MNATNMLSYIEPYSWTCFVVAISNYFVCLTITFEGTYMDQKQKIVIFCENYRYNHIINKHFDQLNSFHSLFDTTYFHRNFETDVHQQKGFRFRFVITFIQFDYKRVQHSKNSPSFVKIESDINPSLFSKQITKPFLLIYFLSDQCLKPHNTRWREENRSLFQNFCNIKRIWIRHLLFNLKNREC